MDLKQIVVLALQVSIIATVFGYGLKASSADLLFLVRRPGLLARSLLAVFVLMPAVAVAMVRGLHFEPDVEIVLVCLALSPVPPLLPMKQAKAGGDATYGVGLMAVLALVSIAAVPLGLEVMEGLFGLPLAMAPAAVAALVAKSMLAPLAAGMAVRAALPGLAPRIEKPVSLFGRVLLPLAVLVLLAGTLRAVGAAIDGGTILAMVVVTVAGIALGTLLGGPDPITRWCSRSPPRAATRRSPTRSPRPTSPTARSARSSCSSCW